MCVYIHTYRTELLLFTPEIFLNQIHFNKANILMRKKMGMIRSLEMTLGTQIILTTDFSTVKTEENLKKKKKKTNRITSKMTFIGP